MGDVWLRSVEEAHQRYFAEHERCWDDHGVLAELPRDEALMVDMVVDEWKRTGCYGRGDGFSYSVSVALIGSALWRGDQDLALERLNDLTGRDWRREFEAIAGRLRADVQDPKTEVLSVLWEQIVAEVDREGSTRAERGSQRGLLATILKNSISDLLGGKRVERVEDLQKNPEIFERFPAAEVPDEGTLEGLDIQVLIEEAGLSERESEAISLLLDDVRGQALAEALGVKTKTAETLRRRAFEKIRKARGRL